MEEQTAKDARDAKGAKDTPVGVFSPAAGVLVNCPGTNWCSKHPEGVPKVLQGPLWFRLSWWEQSFAALASLAIWCGR